MDIFDSNEPKKNEEKPNENSRLDDIVLDKKDKSFDLKKLLLFGGTAILLLIIVIFTVKMFSTEEKNSNEDFFASQPPESETIQEQNFKQIPIIKEEAEEPEEKYEQLIEDVTHEEKTDEKKIKPEKEDAKKRAKNEIKKEKQLPEKKVATKNKTSAKTEKKEPKETRKKSQKTPVVKKEDFYVQVGAFYRLPPDKKFLNRIKRNGYDYVIKTVIKDSAEIKKILIGPFASRDEAKKALLKIRKNIKKDAFIVRIR